MYTVNISHILSKNLIGEVNNRQLGYNHKCTQLRMELAHKHTLYSESKQTQDKYSYPTMQAD